MNKAERIELTAIAESAHRLYVKLRQRDRMDFEMTSHALYIECELRCLIGDKP